MDAMDLTLYAAGSLLVVVLAVLLASGAFRADRRPAPQPWTRFLLGEGWWRLWHLLLLLAVLGVTVGLVLAWAVGPDELLLAFVVLEVSAGALVLATLIDGILWVTTVYRSRTLRLLAGPGLVLVAWLALLALIVVYLQFLPFLMVDSIAGAISAVLIAVAVCALNLAAIRRFHG